MFAFSKSTEISNFVTYKKMIIIVKKYYWICNTIFFQGQTQTRQLPEWIACQKKKSFTRLNINIINNNINININNINNNNNSIYYKWNNRCPQMIARLKLPRKSRTWSEERFRGSSRPCRPGPSGSGPSRRLQTKLSSSPTKPFKSKSEMALTVSNFNYCMDNSSYRRYLPVAIIAPVPVSVVGGSLVMKNYFSK